MKNEISKAFLPEFAKAAGSLKSEQLYLGKVDIT
jgi:hypothetical protein